jgi:hypothetical protein
MTFHSYKNYRCDDHNKFYEVNIYQKDPVNRHHWRATLARPARDIDLNTQTALSHTVSTVPAPDPPSTRVTPSSAVTTSDWHPGGSGVRFIYDGGIGFGSVSDDARAMDFTACDQECGYCGDCDY